MAEEWVSRNQALDWSIGAQLDLSEMRGLGGGSAGVQTREEGIWEGIFNVRAPKMGRMLGGIGEYISTCTLYLLSGPSRRDCIQVEEMIIHIAETLFYD